MIIKKSDMALGLFILGIIGLTFLTMASMYKANKQYDLVKQCLDQGNTAKDCDMLIYGEPQKMLNEK